MKGLKKYTLLSTFFLSISMADISAQISVRIGYPPPPPPRRIERTACPGSDYVWHDPRWVWDDYVRDYVWQRGFWEYAPPPQSYAQPQRYYKKGRGHYKGKGHHKHWD